MTIFADIEKVIAVARAEIGTAESPAYSNKVKYSDWWGYAGPWCGMYVSWCFDRAGHPLPKMQDTKRSGFAYCPSAVNWARRDGSWTDKPKRGDIVLYDFIGRPSHTGIVQGVLGDGRIHTLEGNTDTTGSRTGGRVLEMKRRSRIVGYISVTDTGPAEQRRTVAVEGTRILRHGMSGDDVRFFQSLLNIIACKFGYSRLVEDGVFGDATLWAVSVVQHKKRLVVDGEVGPMTLGAVVAEVGAVTKAKGR